MAFVYRLMEVVVERVKAGLSGLFKRIRYVLVELGLVLLEGQDVVSALVDNRRRYIFLTPPSRRWSLCILTRPTY